MVADVLQQVFVNLTELGLIDVLLPFLIIFTILFAVLQKSKVLGKEEGTDKPKRNFNTIIALAIALLVVTPHMVIPGSTIEYGMDNPTLANGWPDVVVIMNKALPQISLLAVAIIMVMLLVGILGPDIQFGGASLTGFIALISVIAVIIIFGAASGVLGEKLLQWIENLGEEWLSVIIIVLIFGLVIYFVTKEPRGEKQESMLEKLGKQFGPRSS